MAQVNRSRINATTKVIIGVVFLMLGCAIYLLFRSKALNIYQWCSLVGLSNGIDYVRIWVCDWNMPDFFKFNFPDGLYSAAYILIMDAVWREGNCITKHFVIALLPVITITNEVLQYFRLVNGTFDVLDLICYLIPPIIYMVIK